MYLTPNASIKPLQTILSQTARRGISPTAGGRINLLQIVLSGVNPAIKKLTNKNEIHIKIFSRPGSYSGLQGADDLCTKCQAKGQSELAIFTSLLILVLHSQGISML